MSDAIRQHISQLRDEIERRHRESLDALKQLESSLLGEGNAPLVKIPQAVEQVATPKPAESVQAAAARTVMQPTGHGAQVQMVFSAIKSGFKTINQIGEELTGIRPEQIRAVLYSPRYKKMLSKKKLSSGVAFRLKDESKKTTSAKAPAPDSAAAKVTILLEENPSGMTAAEIANALSSAIKSDARNRRNTISSALYNLKKAGKLKYDAETRRYSPASQA